MTVTVKLSLPPKECSPNASAHWATKGRSVSGYRQQAMLAWRFDTQTAGLPRYWDCRVRIDAVFTLGPKVKDPGYRPRDAYNAAASLKAAIDGLVDGGMAKDDSARWVEVGSVSIVRSKVKSGVELTISKVQEL